MKCRIVKRKCGDIEKFTIQQKHFLFRWWWVDAWVNSSLGAACTDTFNTLEEAKNNLWIFDGSVCDDVVIYSE